MLIDISCVKTKYHDFQNLIEYLPYNHKYLRIKTLFRDVN